MGEGLKRARAAARATRAVRPSRDTVIEECAKCVPTNWCDVLLTGPTASRPPLDNRAVEELLRGIQDRIRSLQSRRQQ